jgi:CYTH domain-containing protein
MPAEIERVFLLRALPHPMPAGETWLIEQGYLPPVRHGGPDAPAGAPAAALAEGRLRRIERADGSVELVHTVKRGAGRVREEIERPMDAAEFAREWPRTEGARLRKERIRIGHGGLVWEVDRFLDIPVVLAECEIPSVDTPLEIPPWLAPFVEREVTDEPAFRNFELARRAGLLPGR